MSHLPDDHVVNVVNDMSHLPHLPHDTYHMSHLHNVPQVPCESLLIYFFGGIFFRNVKIYHPELMENINIKNTSAWIFV